MNRVKPRVQGRPLDLVRSLSAAGQQVFTTGDARKYLSEDAALWLPLTRLQKAGWIKRLERGVYLIVPLEAGVERQWAEDAFVVAYSLAQPAAVKLCLTAAIVKMRHEDGLPPSPTGRPGAARSRRPRCACRGRPMEDLSPDGIKRQARGGKHAGGEGISFTKGTGSGLGGGVQQEDLYRPGLRIHEPEFSDSVPRVEVTLQGPIPIPGARREDLDYKIRGPVDDLPNDLEALVHDEQDVRLGDGVVS